MAVDVNMVDVKKTNELAKPIAPTTAKETVAKEAQWQDFLGNLKDEFSKISWTKPEELKTYTKIVVIGTVCFGMGIYLMDLIIQGALATLSALVRWIAG